VVFNPKSPATPCVNPNKSHPDRKKNLFQISSLEIETNWKISKNKKMCQNLLIQPYSSWLCGNKNQPDLPSSKIEMLSGRHCTGYVKKETLGNYYSFDKKKLLERRCCSIFFTNSITNKVFFDTKETFVSRYIPHLNHAS